MSRNKHAHLKGKYYPKTFRTKVLDDLLKTGDSVCAVAKRYEIPASSIYNWIRIFGIDLPQERIKQYMKEDKKRLLEELAEKDREIARLKKEVYVRGVDALAHKKLLEIVERNYGIRIKKKTDL